MSSKTASESPPPEGLDSRFIANLDAIIRKVIPERLQALLDQRGINPLRLAERAHMTPSTVYGSVNGKTAPTLVNLVALAAGLGVSVDELLGTSAVENLARDAMWRASQPN